MKILFVGDIFGRGGRETVKKILPEMIEEHKPDLVLANPENLSHGNGFSKKAIDEMREAGVDFFTSGNHVWDNGDGVAYLNEDDFPVLRPANYPSEDTPGSGYAVVEATDGSKVLVVSLLGRVFMKAGVECPFMVIDRILEDPAFEDVNAVFIDFHAEATAEKYAFGFHVDGRASAVVGTHTHVQTNDARIFEGGTAFISDVGMCGPYDSVIGVRKELVLQKFKTQMPVRFEPETEGQMSFSALLVEVDPETKKALNVQSVLELT